MTCRDYRRTWDEWLDAREGAPADPPLLLEAHEAACAPCRALGARYRPLRRALAALGPPPAPPAGFADRFGPGGVVAVPFARPTPARRLSRFAGAAALLLAGFVAFRMLGHEPGGPRNPVTPPARPLGESLAEATSATWELAREASGPAARIGRGAWVAWPSSTIAGGPPPPGMPASKVLGRVGDRVNAGVRPLSGTARNAFRFLIDPVLAGDGPRDGA